MVKGLRNRFFILSVMASLNPIVSFALKKNKMDANSDDSGLSDGSPVSGIDKMVGYLKYTLWAMSALGIIAIGFMLMFNVQDTILKNVAKIVGVICVIALGFAAPGWFGLNIII